MPRAVKFDRYGGVEVLRVVEVDRPFPGHGQALVRVKAAGINPGEAAIRQGTLSQRWPTSFPSGEGSDFAGIVEDLGGGVAGMSKGDEVIGFTNERASHADYVVAPVSQLIHRPSNIPWEPAGAMFVAGTTAYAAVRAIALSKGETVVVSGAAGGVGSLAIQLARNAGARVIGLASEPNHSWLREHGVIPVTYGEGVEQRIRTTASGPIDAFLDTRGGGYVDLALRLGVGPSRINTIADFDAGKRGVKMVGNREGATAEVLAELAALVSAGRLEIPVARVYPLSEVQAAFTELERRHTHGKIVLVP